MRSEREKIIDEAWKALMGMRKCEKCGREIKPSEGFALRRMPNGLKGIHCNRCAETVDKKARGDDRKM